MSFHSSFPNSIWERHCPRNSIAPATLGPKLARYKEGERSATELPQQARSQMEFGNEEEIGGHRLPLQTETPS
jgi:hypothetical protein